MDKLGPALADCQNTTFTPWEEKPCPPKGPSWEVYTVDKLKCKKDLDENFGVDKIQNYRIGITFKTSNIKDNSGVTNSTVTVSCSVTLETNPALWTSFWTSLNGKDMGQIVPFKNNSNLPNQSSFTASQKGLPLAGKWGDGFLSIASSYVDDYVFLGRVIHFCPNIINSVKMPWLRSFNGAKSTAESANFAENVKTISDVVFTFVDGALLVGEFAVKKVVIELGSWATINRGMSVFSREYQGQITGKIAQLVNGKWQFTEYKIGDVLFDGFDKARNVLLDAKGNYTSLLKANIAQSGLRDEAIRQLAVAKNIPIEWHFAIKADAEIVKQYFLRDPTIGNKIEIIFTPKI